MNWRRGFHRLYAVLTAVWCVLAFFWLLRTHGERAILDIKLAEDQLSADRASYERLNLPKLDGTLPYKSLDAFRHETTATPPVYKLYKIGQLRLELPGTASNDEVLEFLRREGPKLDPLFGLGALRLQKIREDERHLEEVKNIDHGQSINGVFRPPELFYTLGVLLLPPLVVYLVIASAFLTLRWIIRGFRRERVPLG